MDVREKQSSEKRLIEKTLEKCFSLCYNTVKVVIEVAVNND